MLEITAPISFFQQTSILQNVKDEKEESLNKINSFSILY